VVKVSCCESWYHGFESGWNCIIFIIFLFLWFLLLINHFLSIFPPFSCFYLFKITTMHVHLTSYKKNWRGIIILQTYHFNTQSFYLACRETCACFAHFLFISTLKKMFPNGGLNPNRTHRSQTPILLRYLTGIELNWYEQYLFMTKGIPLLYNNVKLTKINGLFIRIGQCKVK